MHVHVEVAVFCVNVPKIVMLTPAVRQLDKDPSHPELRQDSPFASTGSV